MGQSLSNDDEPDVLAQCGDFLRLGGLRQDQRHPAVAEHVGQALAGVGRVQRHIGPAGLEDAQDADDHVQRRLHAEPHQTFRLYPLLLQVDRQDRAALVQLA